MKFPNNILFAKLAGVWCALFGLLSIYWLLGGDVGIHTLGPGLAAQRSDPAFKLLVWMAVFLKWLAGGLVLTLNWKSYAKLKVIFTTTFGLAIAVYGFYGILYSFFMMAGIVPIPYWLGYSAVQWHLCLWSPVWLVGGLFFLLAGTSSRSNV